jgi:hypothetical protein
VLRHCVCCPLRIRRIRDTEHARRELAALRMVWASAAWIAVGDVSNMVREAAAGDAPCSRYRVLSVLRWRRGGVIWRASRRRMAMNEAASAFVLYPRSPVAVRRPGESGSVLPFSHTSIILTVKPCRSCRPILRPRIALELDPMLDILSGPPLLFQVLFQTPHQRRQSTSITRYSAPLMDQNPRHPKLP